MKVRKYHTAVNPPRILRSLAFKFVNLPISFPYFLLCSPFQALVPNPWSMETVLKPPSVPDSTWIQWGASEEGETEPNPQSNLPRNCPGEESDLALLAQRIRSLVVPPHISQLYPRGTKTTSNYSTPCALSYGEPVGVSLVSNLPFSPSYRNPVPPPLSLVSNHTPMYLWADLPA